MLLIVSLFFTPKNSKSASLSQKKYFYNNHTHYPMVVKKNKIKVFNMYYKISVKYR